MKGGKEEEKISSPMFPRLHVNDTDKGGPRPPPRNKMALYEQLCVPSQRFNSSSSLLPSQNAQNVGSSLKKGNGHEGHVLSPFYSSATVSASVEKVNSRSSDGEDARSREREFERSAIRNMNFKSANAVGSVAECSSLHRDASNTKNSSWKRVDDDDDDDDDFRVPTYVNSENVLNLNKDTSGAEKRMLTTLNSSVQLSSSCKRILEQTSPSDPKSGKLERSSRQKLNDMSVLGEQMAQALAHQEAGEKLAESSRFVKSSSDREPTASCLKSCGNDPLNGPTAQSDPHSKASVSHRSMNVADVCNQTTDDKENSSLEQSDAERNDEMSDTSMVDSISGLEISPDDVVGVIGPKQFWKARRTIVNQQRVFAIQVFELHRLIKVQKLLAASPHLLLKENTCTTPQKLPDKNLHIESYIKPQPLTAKEIEDVLETPNPNPNTEYQTESTEVSNKAPVQPPRPSASDNRSNSWCFQPSAHQWLVPIMSPSEGLIYKPYSGPCAPPAGFMTPVYGNYVPNPYVHPSMNPMISSSAIEQTSPVTGPRPNPPVEQNSRSSCNISFPKSDAVTGRPWKVPTSKDSELQGSSASSPCERAQGEGRDALALFPIAPNAEASVQRGESNDKERQTRVIKVTPHNARSATESAARIFRSIQKERQQLEQ